MGNTLTLIANTELSIEEIHDILFDGVESEPYSAERNYFRVNGFNCSVIFYLVTATSRTLLRFWMCRRIL